MASKWRARTDTFNQMGGGSVIPAQIPTLFSPNFHFSNNFSVEFAKTSQHAQHVMILSQHSGCSISLSQVLQARRFSLLCIRCPPHKQSGFTPTLTPKESQMSKNLQKTDEMDGKVDFGLKAQNWSVEQQAGCSASSHASPPSRSSLAFSEPSSSFEKKKTDDRLSSAHQLPLHTTTAPPLPRLPPSPFPPHPPHTIMPPAR